MTNTPVPVSNNLRALMIHVLCVTLIIGCIALSSTVLKDVPMASELLLSFATWLWGKYGFKPDRAVVAKIIDALDLNDVVQLMPAEHQVALQLGQQQILAARAADQRDALRPPPEPIGAPIADVQLDPANENGKVPVESSER